MTDANGNTTRLTRATSGKLTRISSPNGRTVDFSYNAAGLVSALTDNLGRTAGYSYDTTGRLIEAVDPMGGKHDITWDTTNNRITAIRNANGNTVVQNEYNGAGRVTRQTLANGSTFTYAYTVQNGAVTQTDVTDPRGSVRRVQFNATGYVVQNTFPLGTPEQQVITYEISGGRLTASIDALNRRTEYTYDAAGNTTSVTRLAGTGAAVSKTISYDATFGLPLAITDENGHTTTLAYDAKGNLIRITDPLGHGMTFAPDREGRPRSVTDPLGRVTSFGYDGGDLSSVTDALGRQRQRFTDAIGRVIATVDRRGNRSLYDWDDLSRLQHITDALGGVTSFAYDASGNLLGQTDANGNTTSYTYNSQNQLQRDRDALLQVETVTYDAGGLPSRITNRNGQLSSVTYDALRRVKTMSFGATAANPTAYRSQIENTWDAGNRLTQIVDRTCADPINSPGCASVAATSVITRTYDALDHKTGEITPQGEVDYTYDAAGRRTSMTIKNGPPGAQLVQPAITYSYDSANHLTGIHQAAGSINAGIAQDISLAYDAAGQRTQTMLANGSTINYAYDAAGQVTAIVYKKLDGTVIGDLQYEYDAAGHRISAAGSLAQLNLPAADITGAAYDANNRLLTWGGKSYAYDGNGSLVGDGAKTYQWDERNRLVSVGDGVNELASFQYDSRNRRIGKTSGGATTGFLYDGVNIVQELQGTSSTADVKAHLLTTGAIDEVVLRIEGNDGANRSSVAGDASGSTVMLLDAAQTRIAGYAYDPYGATTADGTSTNTQQYTGRENDDPSTAGGLYYYRSRYYMSGVARFVSEDPAGWSSGQTNNYAYVAGDPINFIDPTGLGFLQHLTDFSAGFGDALSFGLTRWVRKKLGVDAVVDPCSGWYTAGDVAGMVVGTVATAGLGGEAKVAEETVDVFRAVGVREFEDVAANQAFRAGGNSLEARQFALTLEDALAYANTDLSKVAILKATLPASLLSAFEFSRDIDVMIFRSGVITVQPELLPLLNDAILAIEHVL
jgi:RHS repeat-associated protein